MKSNFNSFKYSLTYFCLYFIFNFIFIYIEMEQLALILYFYICFFSFYFFLIFFIKKISYVRGECSLKLYNKSFFFISSSNFCKGRRYLSFFNFCFLSFWNYFSSINLILSFSNLYIKDFFYIYYTFFFRVTASEWRTGLILHRDFILLERINFIWNSIILFLEYCIKYGLLNKESCDILLAQFSSFFFWIKEFLDFSNFNHFIFLNNILSCFFIIKLVFSCIPIYFFKILGNNIMLGILERFFIFFFNLEFNFIIYCIDFSFVSLINFLNFEFSKYSVNLNRKIGGSLIEGVIERNISKGLKVTVPWDYNFSSLCFLNFFSSFSGVINKILYRSEFLSLFFNLFYIDNFWISYENFFFHEDLIEGYYNEIEIIFRAGIILSTPYNNLRYLNNVYGFKKVSGYFLDLNLFFNLDVVTLNWVFFSFSYLLNFYYFDTIFFYNSDFDIFNKEYNIFLKSWINFGVDKNIFFRGNLVLLKGGIFQSYYNSNDSSLKEERYIWLFDIHCLYSEKFSWYSSLNNDFKLVWWEKGGVILSSNYKIFNFVSDSIKQGVKNNEGWEIVKSFNPQEEDFFSKEVQKDVNSFIKCYLNALGTSSIEGFSEIKKAPCFYTFYYNPFSGIWNFKGFFKCLSFFDSSLVFFIDSRFYLDDSFSYNVSFNNSNSFLPSTCHSLVSEKDEICVNFVNNLMLDNIKSSEEIKVLYCCTYIDGNNIKSFCHCFRYGFPDFRCRKLVNKFFFVNELGFLSFIKKPYRVLALPYRK